jgi:hypothetical protein
MSKDKYSDNHTIAIKRGNGDLTIDGNLIVNGETTTNGIYSTSGSASFDTLSVTGEATLSDSLSVSGETILNNTTIVSSSGTIDFEERGEVEYPVPMTSLKSLVDLGYKTSFSGSSFVVSGGVPYTNSDPTSVGYIGDDIMVINWDRGDYLTIPIHDFFAGSGYLKGIRLCYEAVGGTSDTSLPFGLTLYTCSKTYPATMTSQSFGGSISPSANWDNMRVNIFNIGDEINTKTNLYFLTVEVSPSFDSIFVAVYSLSIVVEQTVFERLGY